MLRKIPAVLMVVLMTAALSSCRGDPAAADYKDPYEAAEAFKAGTYIVGKTVAVTASQDSYDHVIYDVLYSDIAAHVKVLLVSNDLNEAEINGIKEGDTVVITVAGTNDDLINCIYLIAEKYTIC